MANVHTFSTNDSVHNTIILPNLLKHFIDHDLFQRMRQIKQLGITERVYMCATHTRFEHSIGTAHLAYHLCQKLIRDAEAKYKSSQNPGLLGNKKGGRRRNKPRRTSLKRDRPSSKESSDWSEDHAAPGGVEAIDRNTTNESSGSVGLVQLGAAGGAGGSFVLQSQSSSCGQQPGCATQDSVPASQEQHQNQVDSPVLPHQTAMSTAASSPAELIPDTDLYCICIAALLHDLGHPAFSHMFEVFMRRMDRKTKSKAEFESARPWSHEDASLKLCDFLFNEPHIRDELELHGLGERDLLFIKEMINPPKKALLQALQDGDLHEKWGDIIHGRGFEKAWMFEIVSNWRCGLDVDRFDYFLRDAQNLGMKLSFDLSRYFANVQLASYDYNGDGVQMHTLGVPRKDAEMLQRDFFEQRQQLHKSAYQHRTTKKIEMHMLDMLELLNDSPNVKFYSKKFRKAFSLYEAAKLVDDVNWDPFCYAQITDATITCLLSGNLYLGEEALGDEKLLRAQGLHSAVQNRNLMRNPGTVDWCDCPAELLNSEEQREDMKDAIVRNAFAPNVMREFKLPEGTPPLSKADVKAQLRVEMGEFHQGAKEENPMKWTLLLSKKEGNVLGKDVQDRLSQTFPAETVAEIQRQKYMMRTLFVFWQPPMEADLEYERTLLPELSEEAEETMIKRLHHGMLAYLDSKSSERTSISSPTEPSAPLHPRKDMRGNMLSPGPQHHNQQRQPLKKQKQLKRWNVIDASCLGKDPLAAIHEAPLVRPEEPLGHATPTVEPTELKFHGTPTCGAEEEEEG
mmetsp:Transcript_24525/g.61741  ORF Transcript_24525/g.61741 Transcript_24525/m.61741 type:complete len:794 (+) Transcript_24525:167-2548(+)|eukprot:CAMPEP_0179002066 /NCGR_PEP_ID=MMETSP0795-20121207/11762_1 /TAXON_ID=88552 /ORGANISM="Amoebophrya sp., Strain Ameob2" /LENGTH=793 /DNA_ID=CAMNT_0020695615 /DNA_START=99 /DNA_END=2480 /DNA_ORIENTATION=+